jgi:hypothetical protein
MMMMMMMMGMTMIGMMQKWLVILMGCGVVI